MNLVRHGQYRGGFVHFGPPEGKINNYYDHDDHYFIIVPKNMSQKSSPNHPQIIPKSYQKLSQKCTKSHPKVIQKSPTSVPKVSQKYPKSRPKDIQKSPKSHPKVTLVVLESCVSNRAFRIIS